MFCLQFSLLVLGQISYPVLFANKVSCQKIFLCKYYFTREATRVQLYYSPYLIIGIWKNIYLSEVENTFFRYLKYWFLQNFLAAECFT
jgi:hypothetical protein